DGVANAVAVKVEQLEPVRVAADGEVVRVGEGAVELSPGRRTQGRGAQATVVGAVFDDKRRLGADAQLGVADRLQRVAAAILHTGGQAQAVQARLQGLVADGEVDAGGLAIVAGGQRVRAVIGRIEGRIRAGMPKFDIGRILQGRGE